MSNDSEDDSSLHPNWVALATVKLNPKIFVRSSGTEDDKIIKDKADPVQVAIDESASVAYNEVLQMPSTAAPKVDTRKREVKSKKKRRKVMREKFDKEMLFRLSLNDDLEGIQALIERSIDPEINATDAYGWTALMMASCGGYVNSFRKLLELGADLSTADRKGNTAISLARSKRFQEILEIAEDHQRDCIEISSDEEEFPQEQGTQFCPDCKIEISKSTSSSHQTSTVHLFSCKFKGNTNIKSFGIGHKNKGFQIMRRTGWDGNSALGPRENGKLYPIKTVIRKRGTGLGIKQDSAKITHFKPNDPSSVHWQPQLRALTRKEIHENHLKEKRLEQRLRRDLS